MQQLVLIILPISEMAKDMKKHCSCWKKYIVVNSKFISTDGQVKNIRITRFVHYMRMIFLMVMSDLPNGRALAKCYLVDRGR